MNRSRTLAARICLVAGLFAWVLSSFHAVLHKLVVEHVVCAEHGEVVELAHADSDTVAAEAKGPEIRARAPAPEHAHGCLFELVVFDGLEVDSTSPPSTSTLWAGLTPRVTLNTPRGTPLLYAPKTSPPLTS